MTEVFSLLAIHSNFVISYTQLMIYIDWDDNLIYIASKKAYIIMQKEDG